MVSNSCRVPGRRHRMSHQQWLSGLPRGVIAGAHRRRVGIQRARKHKPPAAVIILLLQLHIKIIRQPPSDIRPVFVPSHHLARWPREACTLGAVQNELPLKTAAVTQFAGEQAECNSECWQSERSRKQGGMTLRQSRQRRSEETLESRPCAHKVSSTL